MTVILGKNALEARKGNPNGPNRWGLARHPNEYDARSHPALPSAGAAHTHKFPEAGERSWLRPRAPHHTMKFAHDPNSSTTPARSRRRSQLFAALLLLSLPLLSGCTRLFVRSRTVPKTVVIDHVQSATVDELVQLVAERYKAITSISATKVEITATTGGAHKGEIKEAPSFSGFILMRKPEDLTVIMQLPVVGSVAMEMVATGKEFKLVIPPRSLAFTGEEQRVSTAEHGLYSLRPPIIRDAMMIPPVKEDEFVARTESSRVLPAVPGQKERVEEPEYNLSVLRIKSGRTLERVRVIHFSRVDLKPFRQDVYDAEGRVVTTILYSNWQKSGDIDFPMSLFINRPLDEYTLKIDILKLSLNQKLEDDQFALEIPPNYTVKKM